MIKLNYKKKGQISQVFIILFSLLIIGLIVVFATKGISGILTDKCTADLLKFQVDVKNSILQYKDYGMVEKQMLLAPCDYTQLCFIDSKATNLGNVEGVSDELKDFMNIAIINGKVLKNVFLYDGNLVTDVGFIPELQIEDADYLCIFKKAGRFSFITQGKGQYTNVLDVTSVSE